MRHRAVVGIRGACLVAGVALLMPEGAIAHHRRPAPEWGAAGRLVAARIEVDGVAAPLYAAADGSARRYFEAREGASYVVSLENRGGERLAVRLSVDGLDVIDGVRVEAGEDPGRMYVLDPGARMDVRGWRTSLSEVRRFTFVDEEASYAARTGQASGKLGWIELDVFREKRHALALTEREHDPPLNLPGDAAADAAESRARAEPSAKAFGGSHPGTGWGSSRHDPAHLVHFDPEANPAERLVLRYEYRSGLQALGILPRPDRDLVRLHERERGRLGFAQPPPSEQQ